MNSIQQALQLPTLPTLPVVSIDASGAGARLWRLLATLLAAVTIPLGLVVATPLVGALFVAVVLFSPILLVFALAQGSIQAVKERVRSAEHAGVSAALEAAFTRARVRLSPSGEV